jgi:aminopeptidase N
VSEYRLPSWQKPALYDLALVPDFVAFTFQGHVRITLELTKSASAVLLNSAELTYPTAKGADGQERPQVSIRPLGAPAGEGAGPSIPCVGVTLDAKAERASFDFGRELAPGRYELNIRFDGVLNDQLAGFYRSTYKHSDGSTKVIGVTQFEATDARRALPCVDEPAAKARFDVTLIVAPGLQAISNMPRLESTITAASDAEPADKSRGLTYPAGLARHRFDTSPIMSTYLLAFIIGEFDYISRLSASGTEVRVYTALGKTHLGEFSLATAVAALDFYNEWFDTPYPLPKMDLLAIPDFAAGAMENWGAITYRETALLVDPANSSISVMQRVARTVCHEIAHMWFGNLVTMEWVRRHNHSSTRLHSLPLAIMRPFVLRHTLVFVRLSFPNWARFSFLLSPFHPACAPICDIVTNNRVPAVFLPLLSVELFVAQRRFCPLHGAFGRRPHLPSFQDLGIVRGGSVCASAVVGQLGEQPSRRSHGAPFE